MSMKRQRQEDLNLNSRDQLLHRKNAAFKRSLEAVRQNKSPFFAISEHPRLPIPG